ncbi:MAG: hypothetical protein IPM39_23660 [Chloroflexi bacterium]|nr:hypothetical protein [Chloroflexota bacterium]
MTAKKDFTYCPECDSRIRLRAPRLGQRIQCRECETALEVVDLTPLELDWAFEAIPLDDEPRSIRTRFVAQASRKDFPAPYND